MSLRMIDIAKEAGVSPATVSLALSGKSSGKYKLSLETIAHVRGIAMKRGYRPNSISVSLRTQKTNTIGVIIPPLCGRIISHSEYAGLNEVLTPEYLMLADLRCNVDLSERRSLLSFMDYRVDGIIAQWSGQPDIIEVYREIVEKHKKPLVLIEHPINGLDVPVVMPDYYAAAYEAVKSMVELGHRKILHASHGENTLLPRYQQKVLHGYTVAMKEAGLEANIKVVQPQDLGVKEVNYENLCDYADQLINNLQMKLKDYTAVVALGDPLALSIAKRCLDRKFDIPESLSVIGMGNFEMSSSAMFNLSTVEENHKFVGQKAAQLLLDMIEGKDVEAKIYKAPVEVKLRGTTHALYA